MMRTILVSSIFAFCLCLPLVGQSTSQPPAGAVPAGSPVPPPGYGTAANTTISISAFDFDPVDSATPYTDSGNTFRYFNTAGGRKVWIAPVRVPSGATITSIGLHYCDGAVGNDYIVTLVDYTPTASTNIALLNAPVQPSCGTAFSPALSYNFDSNSGHVINMIVFQPDVLDGSVRFLGAEVSYKLRVSAPPATPTFSDVPASYPFYQYVEALFAAGITGGCTSPPNPNYCPDAPITRGQMAAFLARALGLHFPN